MSSPAFKKGDLVFVIGNRASDGTYEDIKGHIMTVSSVYSYSGRMDVRSLDGVDLWWVYLDDVKAASELSNKNATSILDLDY